MLAWLLIIHTANIKTKCLFLDLI